MSNHLVLLAAANYHNVLVTKGVTAADRSITDAIAGLAAPITSALVHASHDKAAKVHATTSILTRAEEATLASFVCRLSLGGSIDAFIQSMPMGCSDNVKETVSISAAKAAMPILNKLANQYVYNDE